MPVIIAEQHVQDWTSQEIMASLRAKGYEMRDWHATQDLEKFVPADWLFLDRTRLKVFGIQYKALYRNGSDYWPVDETQHKTLASHPWILYCASEISDVRQRPQALDRARFYASDFPFQSRLSRRSRKPRYMRWRGFIRGFEACLYGRRITSKKELSSFFASARGIGPERDARQAVEYLLLNIERKRGLRLATETPLQLG